MTVGGAATAWASHLCHALDLTRSDTELSAQSCQFQYSISVENLL